MAGLISMLVFSIYSIPVMQTASAAEKPTAKSSSSLRPTYFPNTELLSPDEMRSTALGTGLPTPITRAQKSTAWMVELGNGDVFLFDIGTGSMENLFDHGWCLEGVYATTTT